MNALEKYLNEHLSGSHAALHLLRVLAHSNPGKRADYEALQQTILRNRSVLESLVHTAGFKQSKSLEFAARVMSCLAVMRFRSHGLTPGRLGLVEALEALEVGVHGQTLLWKCLMRQIDQMPEWSGTDFTALLAVAEFQKTTVEALRMSAAKDAFSVSSQLSTNKTHG